jgi:hypothetical protein
VVCTGGDARDCTLQNASFGMTAWGSGRAGGKQIPRFARNDKSFFEGRLRSLHCTGGDARAYMTYPRC